MDIYELYYLTTKKILVYSQYIWVKSITINCSGVGLKKLNTQKIYHYFKITMYVFYFYFYLLYNGYSGKLWNKNIKILSKTILILSFMNKNSYHKK